MTEPVAYEPDFPRPNPWRTVTRWLVVINVAVFVLDYFVLRSFWVNVAADDAGTPLRDPAGNLIPLTAPQPLLAFYGNFSVDAAIKKLQVWRFLSYQFVHANIEHIVLNMFGLLLAGPLVEKRMGRRSFLVFYLACGAAGPAAHILLSTLGLTQMNQLTPLVGASASIYGVLVAAAVIAPEEVIMLALPPVDMKLKNFVLIMIGLSLAAVAWQWQNAGGHAAHLGGALAGWFLSRRYRTPRGVMPAAG